MFIIKQKISLIVSHGDSINVLLLKHIFIPLNLTNQYTIANNVYFNPQIIL